MSMRTRNLIQAAALALPLPARTKVRLYYRVFTPFFQILNGRSGLLNYGQETLVRRTAASLRPGRWLDVGCGVGGPARLLAAERDVDIVGINISREQLKLASAAPRVRFQYGDACSMPLESGSFDGVYAIETAFHYPDKAAFAREAFRVLRPGGRFAMADMVIAERGATLFHHLFHKWLGVLNMHTVPFWRRDLEAAGFRDFTVEDVTREFLHEGLLLTNRRIAENRSLLDRSYPGLLIDLVRWGNEQVTRDIGAQPMRYVLITAAKPADRT